MTTAASPSQDIFDEVFAEPRPAEPRPAKPDLFDEVFAEEPPEPLVLREFDQTPSTTRHHDRRTRPFTSLTELPASTEVAFPFKPPPPTPPLTKDRFLQELVRGNEQGISALSKELLGHGVPDKDTRSLIGKVITSGIMGGTNGYIPVPDKTFGEFLIPEAAVERGIVSPADAEFLRSATETSVAGFSLLVLGLTGRVLKASGDKQAGEMLLDYVRSEKEQMAKRQAELQGAEKVAGTLGTLAGFFGRPDVATTFGLTGGLVGKALGAVGGRIGSGATQAAIEAGMSQTAARILGIGTRIAESTAQAFVQASTSLAALGALEAFSEGRTPEEMADAAWENAKLGSLFAILGAAGRGLRETGNVAKVRAQIRADRAEMGLPPKGKITPDMVRRAHRKQAIRLHSDRNKRPGADAEFERMQLVTARLRANLFEGGSWVESGAAPVTAPAGLLETREAQARAIIERDAAKAKAIAEKPTAPSRRDLPEVESRPERIATQQEIRRQLRAKEQSRGVQERQPSEAAKGPPKEAPAQEAAPEAVKEPPRATQEGQVKEAGRPAPVEKQPAERAPEGKAEARTEVREGAGEEVAKPLDVSDIPTVKGRGAAAVLREFAEKHGIKLSPQAKTPAQLRQSIRAAIEIERDSRAFVKAIGGEPVGKPRTAAPKPAKAKKAARKPAAKRVREAADKKAREAAERIKNRRIPRGRSTGATILIDNLVDAAIYGAAKIVGGTAKFAQWSTQMTAELGPWVQKHLREVWAHSKELAQAPPKNWGRKDILRVVAGQVEKGDKLFTARAVFRYALKHEAKGSKEGFLAGQLSLTAKHADLVEFAKAHLPKIEQATVMTAIANARTPSEIKRTVQAINRIQKNWERREAIESFKEVMKTLKGRVRPEFQKRLDEITREFNVSEPREKTLERMHSLQDAAALDDIGEIPQKLINRAFEILSKEGKPTLREMDPDDIRTITAAIQSIANENSLKSRLLAVRTARNAEEMVNKAVGEVEARNPAKFAAAPGEHVERRGQNPLVKALTNDMVDPHRKAIILAGEDGVVYEVLIENFNRGTDAMLRIQEDARDAMAAKLKSMGLSLSDITSGSRSLTGKLGRVKLVTVELPTATDIDGARVTSMSITPAERIQLLRLLSDSDTRFQVLKDRSQGITFRRNRGEAAIRLKADDIKAIADSATAQEKAIAEWMQGYINSDPFRAKVNEVSVDVFGIEKAVRQDHAPRQRDREYQNADPNKSVTFWTERQLESQGILKPRTGGNAPIIVGDAYAEFFTHINRVAAFVAKTRAIHDATRLVQNRQFRTAVRASHKRGGDMLGDLEQYIRDYAGLDQVPMASIEKAVSGAIRRAHVGGLIYKPYIWIYQGVSKLGLGDFYGWPTFFKSFFEPTSNAQILAEIRQHSPQLWQRHKGGGHQILSPDVAGLSLREFYGGKEDILTRSGMAPIKWVDESVAIFDNWRMAKSEAKALGLKGDAYWEHVNRRAVTAIQRTQPSWDVTSTPGLARSGRQRPFLKLLLLFSSQRLTNFNMTVEAVSRFRHSKGTPRDWANLAQTLFIANIFNGIMVYSLREIWDKSWDGDNDKYLEDHIVGTVERMFGNWPIAGELMTAIMRSVRASMDPDKRMWNEAMRGNIITEAINETIKSIALLVQAASNAMHEEVFKSGPHKGTAKWKMDLIEAAEAGLRGTGPLMGHPGQAIAIFAKPFLPTHIKGRSQRYDLLWKAMEHDSEKNFSRNAKMLYDLGASTAQIKASAKARGLTIDSKYRALLEEARKKNQQEKKNQREKKQRKPSR